jgi:hypothetical protein
MAAAAGGEVTKTAHCLQETCTQVHASRAAPHLVQQAAYPCQLVLLEGHKAALLIEQRPLPPPDQVSCTFLHVCMTQALKVEHLKRVSKANTHTGVPTGYSDESWLQMQYRVMG